VPLSLVVAAGAIGHALAERYCALARADTAFLPLPETWATSGLLGATRLGLLKNDAILVNLGRGDLAMRTRSFRSWVRARKRVRTVLSRGSC
jgi:hypothetical protein